MSEPPRLSCWVLLGMILLLVSALLWFVVYSSNEAPDPAARTPEGALPPRGEPMRPAR